MLVLAAALSIMIGIVVGLFGGGGSILMTPLLVYVLGFDPKLAISASLFIVAITSAVGLVSYARAGRVVWRTGLLFGAAGMVGAFIGGQVGGRLPGGVLLAAFAVMMGTTAIAMIRGRRQVPGVARSEHRLARILLDGVVVGFVTGLVGAGGGFLIVPTLVLLGGLAMPMAVGTSLLVVMMNSAAGFLGYMAVLSGSAAGVDRLLDWPIVFLATGMAVVGVTLGAVLAPRFHPDRLRRAFGWFVLGMAVLVLGLEVGGSVLDYARGSAVQALEALAGITLLVVVMTVLIRWPVRVPVGDFDTTGEGPKSLPDQAVRANEPSGDRRTMG